MNSYKSSLLLSRKKNALAKDPEKNKYVKILSSFLILDDVNLSQYLAEQFIKGEAILLNKLNLYIGLMNLFTIEFIYIPILTQYIYDKIFLLIPPNTFRPKGEAENQISTKNELREFRNLKKKLYLYYILRNEKCYRPYMIKKRVNLEKIKQSKQVDGDIFLEIYKKVNKIRNIREEFRQIALEYTERSILNIKDLSIENFWGNLECIMFNLSKLFIEHGDYLALKE
ncbi:hypothetical protein [Anoxybacillus gonensis]|uniref:hypothetical protein n=1 Tax=Anoxybacillus gonensis TaxID=198467 RepID=UPI000AC89A76|nr:hypothetical protein [Anoxybacillus gonensis]